MDPTFEKQYIFEEEDQYNVHQMQILVVFKNGGYQHYKDWCSWCKKDFEIKGNEMLKKNELTEDQLKQIENTNAYHFDVWGRKEESRAFNHLNGIINTFCNDCGPKLAKVKI